MSLLRMIRCDGGKHYACLNASTGASPAHKLRAELIQAGWLVSGGTPRTPAERNAIEGGRDYCPVCREKLNAAQTYISSARIKEKVRLLPGV